MITANTHSQRQIRVHGAPEGNIFFTSARCNSEKALHHDEGSSSGGDGGVGGVGGGVVHQRQAKHLRVSLR